MKRKYENDKTQSDVIYFVGKEIEKTRMYDQWTLFKVGDRPLNEILEYVNKAQQEIQAEISHIYFTANHSLTKIKDWSVVGELLNAGYTVTVDGFADDVDKIVDQLPEHKDLIVMIAYPIDVTKYQKYDTFVKLDDKKPFFGTNPGVWVNSLNQMMDNKVFTEWEEYQIDKILATKRDLDG